MQRAEYEQGVQASRAQIMQMEQQRVLLNQQLTQVTSVEENNRLVAMINMLSGQINMIRQQSGDGNSRQVAGARIASHREEFMQAVIDLRQLADKTVAEYEELVKDDAVKNALAALNQKAKTKVTIGPSRAFLAGVQRLERAEAMVLTEDVELRKEGGVQWLDVTFNGRVTRPMVFDTGASSVVLPADLAAEIGLKPGKNDPSVRTRVADGSEVEARRMVIPSVRVGKFTVKDVECLVMPAEKANVPPLLGQTFHRNFIYKVNSEAGKLVLSKVETPDAASPKAKAPARSTRGRRPARSATASDGP
jgi:clan AA aspartic protease (TIGR02281 family)